jgi:integrase
MIELHPSLVVPLKAWLKANPERILLFGTEADKPDRHMLRALKRDACRAGLNCGRCKGCKVRNNECAEYTLHRFRRTYTTRMLRATGGDLRSVMQRTGHSDITSVMRYLEPACTIRDAVAVAF